MARRRHTPDQIVRKLHEGEKLLNEGKEGRRTPTDQTLMRSSSAISTPCRLNDDGVLLSTS